MSDSEDKTPEEIAQEEADIAFAAAMPPPGPFFAARVGDNHICPMITGVVPHVGGPILPPGCPTVFVGGLPAARMGDMLTCVGPPDVIVKGSPTVFIGNQPAARFMDNTAHGGMIVTFCPTVIIGNSGGGAPGGSDAFGFVAVAAIVAVAGIATAAYLLTKDKTVNYSKGIDIKGSDEFIKKTKASLDKLNGTPTGKAILDDIGKSGKNVTIVETKDNNGYNKPLSSDANLKSNGKPGKGSDSQLSFNPDFKPGVPSEVVLGHELIHAQHAARGTRETGKTKGVKDEELKTVGLPPFPSTGMTENNLRNDLGVPKRKKY